MSTKKRFTIAPDLANGIRNTMQSASHNQGQLHYDMMAIDHIEPDPANPRQLSLSRHEILHGLSDSSDLNQAAKIKERTALLELCESIKRIGVKNAIEVYKDGSRYRIITGERRYWASLLAEQKTIPVRISQKPDEFNLRYTQWVENINRLDLSLWEKFNNLISMADAYQKINKMEFDEQILQNFLGISTIQAYRYYCLLKADEMIIKLVELGKLNNLKLVQELVSMKDKGARNQIVSWILSSSEEITSLAHYRERAGKKPSSSKSKNREPIQLGKINQVHTAKQLLEIILADARLDLHRHKFQRIDWTSSKAISNVFKALFKTIEKEFSQEEKP